MISLTKHLLLLVLLVVIAGARAADRQNSVSAKIEKLDLYGDPLPPGAITRIGSIRLRHAGLSDLIYLPDGKTIISAGGDRVLRWWDLASGKPMRSVNLQGTAGPGMCQTLSPDGKTLVAQDGQSLVFWEVQTGKELKKLPTGNQTWVSYIYFSPDGKTLAVHSNPTTVSLWDWAEGKERVLNMPAQQNGFVGIDSTHHGYFSRDGKIFGCGGGIQHPIILWDVATGNEIRRFDCAPTISAFSPDNKFVAAACMKPGGGGASFRLFEADSGKEIIQKETPQDGFFWWVDVSPDSKTIAFVDQKNVYLLDRSLKEQRRIPASTRQVFFSADGKWLMGNQGNRIRLWEVSTGKEVNQHPGLVYSTSFVAISPDGRRVATSGSSDAPALWDLNTGRRLRSLDLGEDVGDITGLSFSPDLKALFVGTSSGDLTFWDAASGAKLRAVHLRDPAKVNPNSYCFQRIHLASDGRIASTIEQMGIPTGRWSQLTSWDLDTGKIIKQFAFPLGGAPAWSPNGRTAAYLGQSGVTVADLATGLTIAHIDPNGLSGEVEMSPDGSLLAGQFQSAKIGPNIVVWEILSGKKIGTLPSGPSNCWVLAGDNRTVITEEGRSIRVWDLFSRQEKYRLELPKVSNNLTPPSYTTIMPPPLTPDGRRLVTSEPDGTLLVWDLAPAFRPAGSEPKAVDATGIAGSWADLAKEDPAVAYAAIWKLTDAPDAAVAWLQKQMKPAVDADFARVRKLIKELDDDRFEVRESASRELEKLGAAIEPALRQALESRPSPEVRRRLETLVQMPAAAIRSPELMRRLRAISILERIGSKNARQLLTTLGTGVPHAPETIAAKIALERLAQRPEMLNQESAGAKR
jgi:WD40 repeat protein